MSFRCGHIEYGSPKKQQQITSAHVEYNTLDLSTAVQKTQEMRNGRHSYAAAFFVSIVLDQMKRMCDFVKVCKRVLI